MPKIQVKRSLTNTPATLLYGELGWADSTNRFYIGNSTGSPIQLNTIPSLQLAYNASVNPEILTNATLGALSIRRGSAADSDIVFEVQNNAATNNFTVAGDGRTNIKTGLGTVNLVVAPNINDPNISTIPSTIYTEAATTGTEDGYRCYFNSGAAATSGYFNVGYNAAAPFVQLLDMDDDPSYIEFSTARLGLANPGTFAAPSIINRFGSRGVTAAALSGFSWWSNGGVSGGALTEILSCDKDFIKLPTVTNATRNTTPSNGMVAYNSDQLKTEFYENGAWRQHMTLDAAETITGSKNFIGNVSFDTDLQQVTSAILTSTTSTVFTTVNSMSITTNNVVTGKYKVSVMLNCRHSTTNLTTVEIQLFVNGVADAPLLYSYNSQVITAPISINFDRIFTSVTAGTTFDIRWRRVSGTATVNCTTRSLIVEQIL